MVKPAAGALLVVLLLAGCGGGHGASEPAVSRRAFVAEANRICRSSGTGAELLARLRRLRPPAAVKDVYGQLLRAEEDALAASEPARNGTETARTGSETPEGDPLVPLAIAVGKIAGYARRLGMDACAAAPAGRMPP
jgi:hypothetical protein